jgi:hypothetical protein
VISFSASGKDVNALDAKLRTQQATIIRYLIVNIEEHLERLEKDKVAQAKMNRNRPPEAIAADNSDPALQAVPTPKVEKPKKPKTVVTEEVLNEEIEKALTEDITK